ncbi:MAG: carboxypeptidase regulatory-like domain-containing protein [Planctomycetes bacterium]|nr:carboxypeptidase regulatory-like domain-containing protein [Planctomycetota bacterium]
MHRFVTSHPLSGRCHGGSVVTALVAAAGLALAGCGGPASEKLYPVTGRVTVDGKAPEGVVLLFHREGAPGDVGTGTTDSSGSYKVVFKTNPGLPAGKFKVTASWPDPAKSKLPVSMGATPDIPDLLRSRYAMRDRSEMSVEVSASTTELPTIELSTK